MNGCEWWFPAPCSYGDLVAQAFRADLAARYATVERLNERYGAAVDDWDSILPPRVEWLGTGKISQSCLLPSSAMLDACFCTTDATHVAVEPGRSYEFQVRWTGTGIQCGGVEAEIAWLTADAPQPIRIDGSALASPGEVAHVTATAPENAARAWLLAKSKAAGCVRMTSVSFQDADGRELAPNGGLDPAQGGWHFVRWSAGEPYQVHHHWDAPGRAIIQYTPSMQLDTPCRFPLAAVADWCSFRARSMAEFINSMAAQIRAADPSHHCGARLCVY